ncbi:MAG: RagB/SusD family nutrient uptake outer membrane protein [Niabella sp.]
MKKIVFIISVIFLIGATGCTKRLVSKDLSEINPSIFPSSREDVQALVNAAYYPLRGAWWDGINGPTERGIQWMDCTTEILIGKYGSQQKLGRLDWNPSDEEGVTYFYSRFYNKISGMTLAIDQIQNIDLDEDFKKKAIAEVRCARGLLAYTLFDLYGPLVIAPLEVLKNPLKEEPLARLSHEDMVAFMEEDLIEAAKDLPHPADVEYGRFSKALAKMVLIRLYLHEKRWQDVINVANDIIAYNHFSLSNDYVGMWRPEGAKSSKEVIWAIPCDYEATSQNTWQTYAAPNNYSTLGGWQTVQSTWWFYDTFEPTDTRKTMLIAEYTGTDGVTYSRSNPGVYMDLGPIPLKIDLDVNRTSAYSTVDIIMYRYADVLLSKAEAIANAAGAPNSEAMELVNVVRRRAGLGDRALASYSALSAFNNLVLTERSHEFWCENGQYRADLIRHGKFLERANLVKGATATQPHKVKFPFPLSAISEGKGKFIQNPGYN